MPYIPLERQEKETSTEVSTSADVIVNGSNLMSLEEYATDNIMPADAYIIRIKVHGTENWDRKEVYVTFK